MKKLNNLMISGLLATALSGYCQAHQQPVQDINPSHIFVNGNVLTVDESFSTQRAFAIENGNIVALGSSDEIEALKKPKTTIVDLDGKTVMPAFIDPHVHTIANVQFSPLKDIGVTKHRSVDQALQAMKEDARSTPKGGWLLYKNIDFATQTSDKTELTREMLDAVSTEHPIFVFHAGGHASSVNSKMLELMGVNKDNIPEVKSGGFGLDSEGNPNGMLFGFASFSAIGVIEPFKNLDPFKGIKVTSIDFASKGIGTVGDLGLGATGSPKELEMLQQFDLDGTLAFRVRGYLGYAQEEYWESIGVAPNSGNEMVKVVGYKLSADGSNQLRTGLQRENYPGTDSKGIAYLTEQQLYDHIVSKSAKGFQIAIHGNGDGAIDNIISAVSRAKADGVEVIRPRIEHCSIVQDDQLQKLRDNDISCSFLIGHVALWGDAFREVLGQSKLDKLDRTATFEEQNIPYTLHSDNGVTEFSPLQMVEIAVTRESIPQPGVVHTVKERASREMAIRGVTSTAAWQLMSENEMGSLEVGKYADFVILEQNPMTVAESEIGDIEVEQTWVGGELKYQQ